MSREILKALMQLFALVARQEEDGEGNGQAIVKSFLRLRLNNQYVDQYVEIFDKFVEIHHQKRYKKDGTAKRNSLNAVKVLKICRDINAELTQPQKVVVLLRLIEFVNTNEEILEQELDIITVVADTFNISQDEFSQSLNFVSGNETQIDTLPNILIVNNKRKANSAINKHIFSEGIEGEIHVLWIESVNLYALSYNGKDDLYINGQSLEKGNIFILTPGSSLRNAKISPIYYSDIQTAFMSDVIESKISFAVESIEYKFPNGQLGLRNINFEENSGQLIGIMGSSGSGKSTLLNVMCGNEKPSKGFVKINGIDIHGEQSKIEGVIGMVSQDDLLIEELSVYENLFYNAKLCFGGKNDEEIKELVLDTLSSLGLFKIRDLKVGGPLDKTISGGQRKRLNIALELIREPAVLFLDEPTSGLSSRDSESTIDLLKELTLRGKLVFVVIHQPSSDIFKTFDKLLLIDEGGYPIYYGNTVNSITYFKTIANQINSSEAECRECGNVSPEEIFDIIESKVVDEFGRATQTRKILPEEWNNYYQEGIEAKTNPLEAKTDAPHSSFSTPNKLNQFKVFITRNVLSKFANKQYMLINLLEAPLLAFALAYIIKYSTGSYLNTGEYVFRNNDNLPAYVFIAVVVAIFLGLMVSAEEIIKDRKIRKRERFLHLSMGSYLWSKIAVLFVISAIQTLLFVAIGNFIMEIKGMFIEYWLILFSIACFANVLGLNLSRSFNSVITIYILVPFLIIPQLILSGAIVPFDKLNPAISSQSEVPFVGDIMSSRWGYEALMVEQFKNNDFNKQFYKYDKEMNIASYRKSYWLPELFDLLDKCEENYQNEADYDEVAKDIQLVKREILEECAYNKIDLVEWSNSVNDLEMESLNPTVFFEVRDLLNALKNNYTRKYNFYSDAKDQKVYDLTKDSLSKSLFLQSKDEYENERLISIVTNEVSFENIIEWDGRLVQKSNPVFFDPVASNLGRAHFFAPRKHFLGNYYDTYWFNLAVIWLMTLVLILTLYFNLLKKGLEALTQLSQNSLFSRRG